MQHVAGPWRHAAAADFLRQPRQTATLTLVILFDNRTDVRLSAILRQSFRGVNGEFAQSRGAERPEGSPASHPQTVEARGVDREFMTTLAKGLTVLRRLHDAALRP